MSDEVKTEVIGPPILTIVLKKLDDEGQNMAAAQEVADFSVSGGALIAQSLDGELMIFPLAELEYASLTPQLSTTGGADASSEGDSDRSEDGGVVLPFTPEFSEGSGASEGSDV